MLVTELDLKNAHQKTVSMNRLFWLVDTHGACLSFVLFVIILWGD